MILTFAVVDLKLRYKNSVLGFLWSILEPLLMLGVLYFVFSYIFPSQIKNYPLYILLGIIIWNFFSRSTSMGMNSILGRSGLVITMNFPKSILPISANITSLLMMGLELGVFTLFMVVFQAAPSITVLFFPLLIVFLVLLCIGLSMLLSIINTRYRDVAYMWQVLLYAGFFISPIVYELKIFPAETQRLLLLNPVTQIIDMAHNVILYGTFPLIENIIYLIGICSVIFFVGMFYFDKKGKDVADYV